MNTFKTKQIAFSGVFLALALLLPFFTGQIPQIGKMLLPMHFPVLMCGLLLGPVCGGVVGFIAPLLRGFIWGMPPFMPVGVAMSFELMAYGIVCGILVSILNNRPISTYIALIGSMIVGRIVWGIASFVIYTAMGSAFTFEMFLVSGFANAVVGVIAQIIIIPPIVIALKRHTSLAMA